MPNALNVFTGICATLDLAFLVAHKLGNAPAWLARNMHRFCIVLYFVNGIFYGDRTGLWCFVIGVLSWNWPRDKDDPPRRRRREEKKASEEAKPDWTGAAVPMPA